MLFRWEILLCGNISKGQYICSYGKFLVLNYCAFLGRKKWECLTVVDCIRQEFFHDLSSEKLCKNGNMFTNGAGVFMSAVGRWEMKITHGRVIINVILHYWFTDILTAHFILDYWSEKLLKLKHRVIVMGHHVERKGATASKISTVAMRNLISASSNRMYDTGEEKWPNRFLDNSFKVTCCKADPYFL